MVETVSIISIIGVWLGHMREMIHLIASKLFPSNPTLGILLIVGAIAFLVYTRAKESTLFIIIALLLLLFMIGI